MSAYDEWPRWIGLSDTVPEVRPAEIKPGMSLREIDHLRDVVWKQYPYNKRQGASDWDPLTKTYPADPTGVCRHKAAWLQQRVGGTVLYGRRTDRAEPGMHAVLWVRYGDFGFIVDKDGIWPEQSAPWACDATHRAYRQ
jgi:hypothetical protein